MEKIIFHVPVDLDPDSDSASGIRPLLMQKAFCELGFKIELISGYGRTRKKKIKEVIRRIKEGDKYIFMYSESTTMPNALTESHHIPLFPLIDLRLFRVCKKYKIPSGLYYRDIYWRFPAYKESVSNWKAIISKFFYRMDLYTYHKFIDKIYLPNLMMANYIPIIDDKKFDVLEPGHNGLTMHPEPNHNDYSLKLLYVGGVGPHYQLHEVFQAVKFLPEIKCTFCFRRTDWEKVKSQYVTENENLTENIEIIHKKGEELESHYDDCDATLLYVKPHEYRSFATPFKLFEYLSHGKPIIASENTYVGEFVKRNRIGWSINYSKKDLIKLLIELKNNSEMISEKSENAKEFAVSQTWSDRASKVSNDLTTNKA